MKRFSLGILIISLLLIFTVACGAKTDTTSSTTSQTYTVTRGTIANQLTPTGNLQMPNQAKLTFGASGTVDEISVQIGDQVKAGQILAKLDAVTVSSLQQALLQAQIDVKTAQMNLDNAKTPTLGSGNTVTAPDPLQIEAKELSLERAKLNLDSAQRQLDGSILTAPFDGLVADVNVLVGDKVSTGTVVIRLIDPNILEVETSVNETDIFNVKLGSPASIQVVALTNVNLPATVIAISPAATVSGGVVNYAVKLRVTSSPSVRPSVAIDQPALSQDNTTAPPSSVTSNNQTASGNGTAPRSSFNSRQQSYTIPTLKEGLSVNITIVIQQKENVLLVPSRALTREGNNAFVQVLKTDNTKEKRAVKTGMSDWQNTEITEGLTEGENIVITKAITSSTSTSTPNIRIPMGGVRPGF
jgi:RND family efflux transporter MFP subunit